MTDKEDTHRLVQDAYGKVAREKSSCCCSKESSAASCCENGAYVVPDHPVPESELGLSCGNPLAFGFINAGDIVLDLGSGAGKDVFLAAQKVGDAGRVIGVDMTPDMLKLARKNAAKFFATTGLLNVEFREGKIEDLPVDDASVDLVISNCVINLSPDKPQVFREVYRVLRPGGKMVVSDIVLNRPLPLSLKGDVDLYAACIAGAMLRDDYLDAICGAGFSKVDVLSGHSYKASSVSGDPVAEDATDELAGIATSMTVLAVK